MGKLNKISYVLFIAALSSIINEAASSSNHVQSIDECGGVLDGLAGAILTSKIEVQLLDDGFAHSQIHISEANSATTFHSEKVVTLNRGDRTVYNISGPLIYIHFVTRPDVDTGFSRGTGFYLTFSGVGENVGKAYKYSLMHSNATEGAVHVPYQVGTIFDDFKVYSMKPLLGRHLAVTIVAPISIGSPQQFIAYYYGCNDENGAKLILTEHEYWKGTHSLLLLCRSEPTVNTTITSPHPLVLTFYSAFKGTQTGFGVIWENVIR